MIHASESGPASQAGTGENVLEAALGYAARGWRVFPLVPRTKRPLTEHGFQDATTDTDIIRAWWTRNPCAGVAIAAGAASRAVVLDIDPRHDGEESLIQLEHDHGALPDTPVSLTGGGGTHSLLKYPALAAGESVPCRTALGGYSGVDLKADDGYIVAPPSIHPNGRCYAWNVLLHPDDVPLAPVPEWIVKLAAERQDLERVEYARTSVTPENEAQLANLIGFAPRVCERFYRSLSGLADTSPSGVDYSLACMLAFRGVEGAAIEHALRASREAAGLPAKGATYYRSTIGKAIASAQLVRVAA